MQCLNSPWVKKINTLCKCPPNLNQMSLVDLEKSDIKVKKKFFRNLTLKLYKLLHFIKFIFF